MVEREASRPLLAFVHIFKTAGTTFNGILRRNFGTRHFDTRLLKTDRIMTGDQLRRAVWLYPRMVSIAGHGVRPYGGLETVATPIHYVTFLRRPAARMISGFQFSARHHILREGWAPANDGEVLAFFDRVAARMAMQSVQALSATADLGEALETLENRIGFVGTVERYDRSLRVMSLWAATHGIELDVHYRRSNVSGDGKADAALQPFADSLKRVAGFASAARQDPAIQARLLELGAAEQQLYDLASRRLDEAEASYCSSGLSDERLESEIIAEDRWYGRAYRNLVGRPVLPLLIRGLPAHPADSSVRNV